MGKSTIVQSTVTKKPLDLFKDDVDVDSKDYSDDTPVVIPLGKLREMLHNHIDLVFGDSSYKELIQQYEE